MKLNVLFRLRINTKQFKMQNSLMILDGEYMLDASFIESNLRLIKIINNLKNHIIEKKWFLLHKTNGTKEN